MNPPQGEPPGDAELISSVRLGDPAAFGILYQRHAAAVTSVARYYANDDFTADDLVSEAFERTFIALRDGGGPDVSFRAYIYTAVRRLAFERTEKARRTHVTDDFTPFEVPEVVADPAVDSFERRMVAGAFAGLPERWQAVLWYLEVEGLRPPEVAVLLGLTANGVSALAYRAREGLREAYLQAHISTEARDAECDRLRGKIGAYVNGTLAARDTGKVEAHVRGCDECSTIVAELQDDGHRLRAIVAPMILGGAAASGLLATWPAPVATAAVANAGGVSSALGTIAVAAASVAAVAGIATALALSSPGADAPPSAAPPPAVAAEPSPSPSSPSATPSPTSPPRAPVVPAPDAGAPESDRGSPVTPAPAPPAKPTPTPTPPPTPTPTPTPTPALSLSMIDVGDLVLGRAGMVGVTALVDDATATDVTLSVDLPDGVTVDVDRSLDTPAGWTCAPTGDQVTCATPKLGADQSTSVFVPVLVSPAAEIGAAPTATVSATASRSVTGTAAGVVADGLGTRFIANGSVASTMVGSSFLSCDPQANGCSDARDRVGDPDLWDNHSWALVALDRLDAGAVSSGALLDLPLGSTIEFAGLYWSADTPEGMPDAELGRLELVAPGGTVQSVSATVVDHAPIGGTDRYQAFADVTSVVAGGGGGEWIARGPMIGPGSAAGVGDEVRSGSHAGWSLVVVYEHPDVADGRVTVFDGFALVTDETVSFSVAGLPDRDVAVGVVAWEGDAALVGDGVSLDDVPLVRALGPADPSNVFTSFAVGSGLENTFGVDVGEFEPTRLEASRGTVSVSTAGDHFAVGVVTVSTQ